MADNSAIEWTDATWNPIRARNLKTGKVGWHCEHATTGCEFCYAEGMNKRLGTGLPFKPGHRKDIEIFLDEKMLLQPLRWKKPRVIFPNSMTDLFADFVPDDWIDKIFAVMALTPHHTYQPLTKRSARMREHLSDPLRHNAIELAAEKIVRGPEQFGGKHVLPRLPLPNVWLGVSTERQQEADERIPDLLLTPAAVRFISAEPLLGPINLEKIVEGNGSWGSVLEPAEIHGGTGQCVGMTPALDWVICGGESGHGARPMHSAWARSLRDQCAAAGVAFFFKQWGEYGRVGDQPGLDHLPEDADVVTRVGKKAAGRLLDGVEYNGMPEPRA